MLTKKQGGTQSKQLIQASATIQISNNMTLLQRKIWTATLYHAYHHLLKRDKHVINLKKLAEYSGYNSKDYAHFQKAALALPSISVRWNILDKDDAWKGIKGAAAMLADAEIEEGIYTYSYGAIFREKLYNPRMYAKLSMEMMRQFGSKYGYALFLLGLDYFDESRDTGETPFIPLPSFRELMGIDDGVYSQFKDLNKWVIKPGLNAVNTLAHFSMDVERQRVGRRIAALKFKMMRKKEIMELKDDKGGKQSPESLDLPGIAFELVNAGVSRGEALKISNRGWEYVNPDVRPDGDDFSSYIKEKIHLAKNTRGVDNKGGFIITALKANWANPEFEAERRAEKQAEIDQQIKALEEEQREKRRQMLQQIVDEMPQAVEEALQRAMEESSLVQERYNPDKSAIEHYQDDMVIRGTMSNKLKEKFADRFKLINEEYEAKIAELKDDGEPAQFSR